MTREVVTATGDMTVRDAVKVLLEAEVKRLPVVDGTGGWLASSAGGTC
jgi:CBS domain-containing protein